MRKKRVISLIFAGLCIFASGCPECFAAGGAEQSVKEANRLYQKGKLDEALEQYNNASVASPDSAIVNFNIGAVLYKKEDYQKAQEAFTKALASDDKKIEADALYNLGNCKYKLGKLKENTDLSSTVAFLRESLDYYKRAVEIDQKNSDARFNHEFIERELKVLLDKLKQQESNQDKQQEGQKQQQEQKEQKVCPAGKDQGEGDKEDGKEKKDLSPEEGRREQENAKESQEAFGGEEAGQEQEQSAKEELELKEQGEKLSKESARALLERYGRDEAAPDYLNRRARGYDREVLKNW